MRAPVASSHCGANFWNGLEIGGPASVPTMTSWPSNLLVVMIGSFGITPWSMPVTSTSVTAARMVGAAVAAATGAVVAAAVAAGAAAVVAAAVAAGAAAVVAAAVGAAP